MVEPKSVDMSARIFRELLKDGRPKCIVDGCQKSGQHTGRKRKDGTIIYRAQCSKHHFIRYGINDWEYKRYRKTYCENIDGRLGFTCTATIIPEFSHHMLDVDHINNNHTDNRKCNLQTLCSNCHRLKTSLFGHLTNLSYIKKLFSNNKKLTTI